MPLPSFSNSLGLQASAPPDSTLGSTDFKRLGGGGQAADELDQYFGEWCGANQGVVSGDVDSTFKTAFNEYRQQRIEAGDWGGLGRAAACETRSGTSLGGYAIFRASAGTLVAFFTPGELKASRTNTNPLPKLVTRRSGKSSRRNSRKSRAQRQKKTRR